MLSESDSKTATLRSELEQLRDTDVPDFLAARRRLESIVAQVAASRESAIAQARQQLGGLDCPKDVRQRISQQLDQATWSTPRNSWPSLQRAPMDCLRRLRLTRP